MKSIPGILFATLLLLGTCSNGDGSRGRNKAAEPTNDLVITRNAAYGPGSRNRLDVYALREPGGPRPIVVYLYGGAWTGGVKESFAWVGIALARNGYVAVIPDYRVHPEGLWPKFLEDNAAAVRWAKDHAASLGGDPSALVVMGHSAGAFNAVSLAVDKRWLTAAGLDPVRDLRAVIGLSGPYYLLPLDTTKLLQIFGPESRAKETQPITHVDGRSPPVLMITGDRDQAAEPRDSDNIAAKILSLGGVAKVIHYPSMGHNDTEEAIPAQNGKRTELMDAITKFIADPR